MRTRSFLDRNVRWIFPLPALLFILAMMAFPIVYTAWTSLTGWSLSAGTPPDFVGARNYVGLAGDGRFGLAVVRTVAFTLLALTLEVVLGVAIALLLDRDYPGKRVVNAVMLLPMMATPVAIAMVWLFMYEPSAGVVNFALRELGLPTSLWIAGPDSVIPALALVDIWQWTPMIILISLAGLAGLPADAYEAAKVDGASPAQTLWRITLPMLMPTVSVAALLRLIDALKTFDIIYAMTGGGPGFASETLNIYAYQQAFSYFSFGYASAVLVLFFTVVLGVSLGATYFRRVVEV
jgi:multiple sugar transport system permease protein